MPITAGTQFGRYEIRSLLGVGGMGEVYLAQDIKLKRNVALKVLSPKIAADQQKLNRFAQEARAASALNHPNVVSIYEIEEFGEICFIAMEYIDGETLRQRLSRSSMTISEVLDFAVQIAGALVAAHRANIVHRDMKADNVMVSRNGYVKVLDFGLAKPLDPSPLEVTDPATSTISKINTAPGVVMGTVSYMSPEQARGLVVDARTDLWSLGVVIYEMVAGKLPFEGTTANDVIVAVLNREPHPLARFNREVPEVLEWIVAKALTKDLEDRYQTAKELLADLQRLKHRLTVEAELEHSAPPKSADPDSISAPPIPRTTAEVNGDSQTTVQTQSPPTQSSVEYLVNEIKQHKAGAAVVSALLVLLLGTVVFAAFYFFRPQTQSQSPTRALRRLTFDSGLQCGPTWSPDGSFIAYSSDRKGNFDIWVQQADGSNPMAVTTSPFHDWQPDWSPDGKSIVFRSERSGGGLFVVPAFGGIERKLSSFGYRPRWSPDGSKILFLSAGQRVYDFPKVYVMGINDAQPREIPILVSTDKEAGVRNGSVAWHPDGRRISFLSVDGAFWTIPLDGSGAVKSEMTPEVQVQFREATVELGNFSWAPTGTTLYFEGRSQGVLNLWKVSVDAQTLRWVSGPERLTTGIGQDTDTAISRDGKKLAFATTSQSTRLWLLPFASNSGQLKGAGQPITPSDTDNWFVDLSRDGKKLVYSTRRYGMDKQELWERYIETGRETLLAADNYIRFLPRLSPDGRRLAYSRFRSLKPVGLLAAGPPKGMEKEGPIVLLDEGGSQEQFLTTPGTWLDYMYDWSPDGQWILGSTNRKTPERWQICLFPLAAAPHAETEMRVIVSDSEHSLWAPRFSPDGRWISYISQKQNAASDSIIYVVPATGGTPIQITEANSWSDWPRWSPDGKTIYFASNKGSIFINVWAVQFDSTTGRRVSEPVRVTSYESPSRMLSTQLAHTEMSISENWLALPITEVSGSLWALNNIDR